MCIRDRLTDILDGVSSLVAAETARLSLEDEVDQATAKAIGAPEPKGAPRAAAEPAGLPGPTGPSGPRPAAPQPAPQVRPGAPSPTPPSSSQASQSSPAQAHEKHSPARAAVIDPDEQAEGVRMRPGGDN